MIHREVFKDLPQTITVVQWVSLRRAHPWLPCALFLTRPEKSTWKATSLWKIVYLGLNLNNRKLHIFHGKFNNLSQIFHWTKLPNFNNISTRNKEESLPCIIAATISTDKFIHRPYSVHILSLKFRYRENKKQDHTSWWECPSSIVFSMFWRKTGFMFKTLEWSIEYKWHTCSIMDRSYSMYMPFSLLLNNH